MVKNHAIITGGAGYRSREENDFYATPKEATELFLANHDLKKFKSFLEPACGQGHISEVLKEQLSNATIVSSDLIDRGYGLAHADFLKLDVSLAKFDVVITNPPFKLAVEFIKKALTVADHQVIMFLKIQFLETKTRQELFSTTPLKYVYVHSKRVSPMRNGSPTDEKGKPWSSAMCFAWFVWQKGYEGDPMIKFL